MACITINYNGKIKIITNDTQVSNFSVVQFGPEIIKINSPKMKDKK